jgi:YgiT-type zinc finger domain-containing protein
MSDFTQPTSSPPSSYSAPCSECQAGILRLQYITYFTWLNDELITVPNFPAWVCDVCGRREYDPRAINWLNTLLLPETGRRTQSKRQRRPPHPDRPARQRPRTT